MLKEIISNKTHASPHQPKGDVEVGAVRPEQNKVTQHHTTTTTDVQQMFYDNHLLSRRATTDDTRFQAVLLIKTLQRSAFRSGADTRQDGDEGPVGIGPGGRVLRGWRRA